ncbi:E3 ubiquitin-protein ligase herc4, partial [Globisporangium splendens]
MECVGLASKDVAASVDAAPLFGECAAPHGVAFSAVDGGESFSIGIDTHGAVVGWGSAFYGELGGDGNANDDEQVAASRMLLSSTRIPVPVKCVQVACGMNHVLVVSQTGAYNEIIILCSAFVKILNGFLLDANASGSMFAWGWNRYGQVAQSEAKQVVSIPSQVTFSDDDAIRIQSVAAGGMHSLALDSHGRVWSWGHNGYGQLGIDSEDELLSSPAIVSLPNVQKMAAIAAGLAHTAVLTANGDIHTCGWGLYQQLGHGSTQDERKPRVVEALRDLDASCGGPIVQIACGSWHTAARTQDGDVYTWGWGKDGQLGHAGARTSQALPRVVSDGYFDADEAGRKAIDVACGVRHTLVLCANGDVHWWGIQEQSTSRSRWSGDAWGKLKANQQCVKVAAGHSHALLLVQSDQ